MARTVGSFDDLSDRVQEVVRRKVEDRREESRRRAQKIKDDAQEKAGQIETEILEDAKHRADDKRRRQVARAEEEAKHKRLRAREEIVEQIWDQAETELRELVESDEYAQALRQMAWLAVQTLGPGHLVLAADPNGHDLLTEDRLTTWGDEATEDFGAPVEFERASEALDAWGGLVASENQGRKRMDARFSTRLETARSELRDKVFRRLMGEA
jgi:V/A-type H+-transporting ATPase subunit E